METFMSSEYIVSPSQIEPKLTTVWDSLQGTGKTRACLFNLIIYTQNNKRVDYLYSVAQKVISKFPSRVIFVTIDEEVPKETLKTSVSVISSESELNPTACDLINILLSMQNRERAPFMILPHIITDLPVYLLWADDPSKNDPVSQKLERLATRVIFDSESTDSLLCFAKAVLNHKKSSGSDIADLNWARIEGWRQLLTETFKGADKLAALKNLSQITLHYNCLETKFFCHTKIQALYLQGWIARQMGWTFSASRKQQNSSLITYKTQDHSVQVELKPKQITAMAPGRILEVDLLCKDGELFHFSRSQEDPHIINIHHSTPTLCQLPMQFIFDRYESGQSLVKEIFHHGTSSHFFSLLQWLSSLKGLDIA